MRGREGSKTKTQTRFFNFAAEKSCGFCKTAWRSIDRAIEYLGIHVMMRYSFHPHKWGYWLYYNLQGGDQVYR